jgi:glycosyltransferase involved in cell wall biosynthesis
MSNIGETPIQMMPFRLAEPNAVGPTPARILIAHPGRQHSHQAALALLESGLLGCYATGIPVSQIQLSAPWRGLVRRYSSHEEIAVPPHLTRLNMLAPVVNRLTRFLPEFTAQPIFYETLGIFDRWVAGLIARNHFDGVIAYENSALHTFRAARKSGAKCILDAASLHRTEADSRYKTMLPNAYQMRMNRLKDLEVELADCIFTTSELAAQSYLLNIGRDRCVKTITLGVDVDRFTPNPDGDCNKTPRQEFTFVFVGTATVRKGFDCLLESIDRLVSEGLRFRILVAGTIDRSLLNGRKRLLQRIDQLGMVSHNELPSLLRSAHCLILPSRLDAFGMVVPEAMACGIPVIVSDMVGAKQIVEEGRNGFVVPAENVEALVHRMRWCIQNMYSLKKMSGAARATAECLGWASYRHRLTTAVREVLQES